MSRIIFIVIVLGTIVGCKGKKEQSLPIFGQREVVGTDTVYHQIAKFQFVDQDSSIITNQTFKNQIYVSDFF
ncbi:MAG: SCO family protein, partial [Cyclobacteriaceae bacterium]